MGVSFLLQCAAPGDQTQFFGLGDRPYLLCHLSGLGLAFLKLLFDHMLVRSRPCCLLSLSLFLRLLLERWGFKV